MSNTPKTDTQMREAIAETVAFGRQEGRTAGEVADDLFDLFNTELKQREDTSAVDRVEVIDDTGRVYVKGSIYGTPVSVKLSKQDEGKTLKIFVDRRNT